MTKITGHSFDPDSDPENEHMCAYMTSLHSTCDHPEEDHEND